MSERIPYHEIRVQQHNVNDVVARLNKWLVPDGASVKVGDAIATLETTKATFDINAPNAGYLFHLKDEGQQLPIGTVIAVVSESVTRPKINENVTKSETQTTKISHKALALMKQHGLTEKDFPHVSIIRSEDVELLVSQRNPKESGARASQDVQHEAILKDSRFLELQEVLNSLRDRMQSKFKRHVSTGDLLHDRWELAKRYGFGEGSSVYDSCLILGDVSLGKSCWVGPFTVLDGAHAPLSIGDHTSIGSGAQIYTHHTIYNALTGGKAKTVGLATEIGACCFISPMAIISPGSRIGDHSFVATASYVEGTFPANSYLSGNPARVVGRVEVNGESAKLILF